MGFIRVWLVFLVLLLALYLVLRVVLTLRERARLAREWEEGSLATQRGPRDAYVRAGMDLYAHSLRRRLLWGVIVGPMAALGLLLYLLNIN